MIEEVRKLRNMHPFSPYVIVLTDGQKFHITDQFHVGLGGTTIGIYDELQDRFLPLAESLVEQVFADKPVDHAARQP